MHFVCREEKDKWIEYYDERETAWARKRVKDAEGAVQQEQEDIKHGEIAGFINRVSEQTSKPMRVPIRQNLSDLGCSDNWEHGEDKDDEGTEQGNLSEDDEPSWVMGTITKMVQHHMERWWQKQMKLGKLTRPGQEDAAHCFRKRDT